MNVQSRHGARGNARKIAPAPGAQQYNYNSYGDEDEESCDSDEYKMRDRCCMCVELRAGVTLIGMFIIVDIVMAVFDISKRYLTPVQFVGANKELYCGLYALFKTLDLYAFYLFVQYWIEDTVQTRSMLSRACCYMMLTQVLVSTLTIVTACIRWLMWESAIRTCGFNFISFVMYLYFTGMVVRWYRIKLEEIRERFG